MILFDWNNIVMSAFSNAGGFDEASRGRSMDPSAIRHIVLNNIRSVRKRFVGSHGSPVLCADHTNNWRRKIFPHYKASRRKGRESDPEMWRLIYGCFDVLREEFRENLPYPVVRVEGAEADDVIAVLSSFKDGFVSDNPMEDMIPLRNLVYSRDRDFLQLVTERTDWYNVQENEVVRWDTVDATTELLIKIIRGDVGDGVPNVFSPADVLVTEGTRQTPATKKRVQAIVDDAESMSPEVRERFELNRRMVDLMMIPRDVADRIVDEFHAAVENLPPRSGLLRYLSSHRLTQLTEHLNDF